MGMFKSEKPRAYSHQYIYVNERKEKLNKILAENTGKDVSVIAEDTERDNFMTAEEALEYGLVDKILYKRD